ncbi:MAG TPA: hypothetical protein VHY76_00165 [Acetobacteraceae bacterium]|nr:hypothetical protein [Acetobacteraceae bacterium]
MLPTPRMPPLAWFWTGLLATGTASAACLQWLGPPPRVAVATMAPPAVAPPGELEVAAVGHATYLPADPALAAEAVAVTLPVPPMPPARHPRTRRHVSLAHVSVAHGAAARWRRPPPPLRVPELERWRTPYPAPLREGYEYFPAGGYYVWRY